MCVIFFATAPELQHSSRVGILKDYPEFGCELPDLCRKRRLLAKSLDYTNLNYLVLGWLEADADERKGH